MEVYVRVNVCGCGCGCDCECVCVDGCVCVSIGTVKKPKDAPVSGVAASGRASCASISFDVGSGYLPPAPQN
eukprot:COSAG05_NODE_2495_length_2983_cov_12.675535_5_plen_72_part_00